MIRPAPELADGGYWYLVPAVVDPVVGGPVPAGVGSGYCCWLKEHDGEQIYVVRTPNRRDIADARPVRVSAALAAIARKPRARLSGR